MHPHNHEKKNLKRKATREELSKAIQHASIEFGFEKAGTEGVKSNSYSLDEQDFEYSHSDDLDFMKIKVKGNAVSKWGHLNIEPIEPRLNDAVPIIQHPQGEHKKVVLEANHIRAFYENDKRKILYTTDTEGGSSGSPVFNLDWKVIALHHAGSQTMQDGEAANRGVLFKYILPEDIPVGTRTFIFYDKNDIDASKELDKHLFILKMNKEISIFDMHQDVAGGSNTELLWEREILKSAIVLVLVTPNLLNPTAFSFLKKKVFFNKNLIVVPVLIRKCNWQKIKELANIKPLPSNEKFVEEWDNIDAAYADIAMGVELIIKY